MEDKSSYTLTYSIARSGSLPSVDLNRRNRKNDFRVDLKKIEIIPTDANLNMNTDAKLSVILRHNNRDICLCLNERKDIVSIPLHQVVGFRITEYKIMEILLLDNFERSYYSNGVEIKGDPTNGLLEGANSLIFIPLNYVNLNNLVDIEAGIARYRVEKQSHLLMNDTQNSQPDSSDEIYVTFVLFVERGAVVVPRDITLKSLLNVISSRFHLQLNTERMSYKNGVGDMITLKDEEDWKVAKWEAKYEKKIGVEVHLA
ncbi:11494_t:CDS:2 [Acaulospora morrowiae]|uniref:11494_t:CDS:1 n=1 Tax=Acaulospora morrowiae TaxID=94023 RepID=A0A9N9CCE5_9GLOM|nr:11494_t:CDS:2 [Acaulospora morrowiae]